MCKASEAIPGVLICAVRRTTEALRGPSTFAHLSVRAEDLRYEILVVENLLITIPATAARASTATACCSIRVAATAATATRAAATTSTAIETALAGGRVPEIRELVGKRQAFRAIESLQRAILFAGEIGD